MSDTRHEDRIWVEAVDHYVSRAKTRRPARAAAVQGRGSQGRWVLASAVVLALLVSPFAVGATGDVLREGKRNPGRGSSHKETEIISSVKSYGTRQSNVRDGNGGGAIYGCRSKPGREPCIRSNNLKDGRAFEFATGGAEGGRIEVDAANGKPLTTNATGVATGFNADRVDSLDAGRADFRAGVGGSAEVLNLGGLVLRGSCSAGPNIDVRADTSVPHSVIHVEWNKDPGNAPFYREDNNLNPGDNFQIMSAGNDDAAQGTLTYSSPAGVDVSLTFLSEEGGAFAGATPCLFAGTALASSP
jgi:hypothetical protein